MSMENVDKLLADEVLKDGNCSDNDDVFLSSSSESEETIKITIECDKLNRDSVSEQPGNASASSDCDSSGHGSKTIDHNEIYNGFLNPSFDHYNQLKPVSLQNISEKIDSSNFAMFCNASESVSIEHSEKIALLRKFSAPTTEPLVGLATKRYETVPAFPSTDAPTMHETNLNDKYKCMVCHNPFNDPRVLDCLHIFCLNCLFGIERNGRQGRRASQPGNGISDAIDTDLSG